MIGQPEDDSKPSIQDLGERFAAMVGANDWQIDGLDESGLTIPFAEPPLAEPIEETTPELPTQAPTTPITAEAVVEPTIPPSPIQIIEAMLFVGGRPVSLQDIQDTIRGISAEQTLEMLATLKRIYLQQHRPYTIDERGGGYVLHLRPKYSHMHERMFGGPQEKRLNQQALDVLSLIAYRQPFGKSEVDTLRGQDSANVVRQLVRLGLITVAERATAERETLYGTTNRFLELFNLRTLDDLPTISEAKKVT